MKTKKILFIEAGTTGGGSFESLYQLLKVIDRKEIIPHVICFNKTKYIKLWGELDIPVILIKDKIYTISETSGINYLYKKLRSLVFRNIKIPFSLILNFVHYATIKKIRKLIKNNSIDIVYLNNQIQRDLIFVLACKSQNVKIISHLRSTRERGFNKKMANYTNKNVDFFIANSKSCKSHWMSKGISPNKTKVLYNFIGEKKRPMALKKQNSILTLGMLANYSEAKGHDFLIEAFKDLVKKNKKVELYLAGNGSLEKKIKEKVNKYNLTAVVKFLGYVEDSHNFFSTIDILIVPSNNEAFGIVILQAMQAGVPVIATNIGGIPEIITHRYNGLLIDYGNKEELIESVLLLAEEESLKETILVNADKTIKENFSSQKYLQEINNIFRKIE